MGEAQFVAFYRPCQPAIIEDASFVKKKSAQMISDKLNLSQTDEFLSITTPLNRKMLEKNIVVVDKYPQLILKTKPGNYLKPDYYFSILPNSMANLSCIYVKVTEKSGIEIPPFEVTFNKEDYTDKKFSDFSNFILEQFDLGVSEYSFEIGYQRMSPDSTALSVISNLDKYQLILACKLNDESVAKVNLRHNIINELITTEVTFIKGLQVLIDYWKPNLLKLKMITEDEANFIFHEFPVIINFHSQFLENLQSRGSSYSSFLSDVFIEFSSFFKISLLYITSYSSILQLIYEKAKSKDFKSKLKQLANDTEDQNELVQYLITPVQRTPRYMLFLKQLIHNTPKSHPDFPMLKFALQKIEEVAKQIDHSAQVAENNSQLLAIQNNLLTHFDLVIPSRTIVMTVPINFKKPKAGIGMFYLFNDLVMITREERGGQQLIHDESPFTFSYKHKKESEFSFIGSDFKRGFNRFQFFEFEIPNQKQREALIEKLTSVKNDLYSKQKNNMFQKKRIVPYGDIQPLSGHDASFIGNSLYIFGGISNGEYSDNIYIYKASNSFMSFIPTNLGKRIDHSVTCIDTNIYIFGGMNNAEIFNDIWCFDTIKLQLNKIEIPENNKLPEPRYAHSAVSFCNCIYIFGGINKKKKLLNDLWEFNTINCEWKLINLPSQPTKPIAYHSMNVINNIMYIHGGINENNEPTNDFYMLNLIEMKWIPQNSDFGTVLPRAMHRSVTLGSFIIYIGGTDSKKIVPPAIFDTKLKRYQISTCTSKCKNLINFSLSCYEKTLYTFGGNDIYSKQTSLKLYNLTIPPFLDSMLEEEKIHRKPFANPRMVKRFRTTEFLNGNNINNSNQALNKVKRGSLSTKKRKLVTVTRDHKRSGSMCESSGLKQCEMSSSEKQESDSGHIKKRRRRKHSQILPQPKMDILIQAQNVNELNQEQNDSNHM
ncbi:Kelch motif family protein [Histomonas meleagridis]|uniref:Kelch motif family protein n=1 Tax=Histomonas meleagridis TaxID=135588 RepID=UPI00355A6169|nr:Kelch motif family protein [Histomonas meleagridis]KAH0797407.1 Kelch motif family protein [Histomonas meleagridis]